MSDARRAPRADALRRPGARSIRARPSRSARESEGFYRASSWRLIWWKFQRHRVAVAAAFVLLAFYAARALRRGRRALRPDQAQRRLPLRAAAGACTCSTRAASSGPSSTPTAFTFDLETFRRDYVVDATKPQPLRFLCRGDAYEFWGLIRRRLPPRLPAGGRHAVPARHRPARARPVLAHHLRRAHLAHDRPRRHRGLLHARPLLRRARRLSRRLGRPRRPAHDRDPALAARTAALARPVGGAAAELEPAPRLLRHHHHPRPARLAGPRPRRALQAAGPARGGFRARRRADGRLARRASSRAT